MIRIDAVWLAVAPLDMRAGMDTALGRVVTVFGSAQPHHDPALVSRTAGYAVFSMFSTSIGVR